MTNLYVQNKTLILHRVQSKGIKIKHSPMKCVNFGIICPFINCNVPRHPDGTHSTWSNWFIHSVFSKFSRTTGHGSNMRHLLTRNVYCFQYNLGCN